MVSQAWRCIDQQPGSAGFLRLVTRRYVMPDGQVAMWDILTGGRTVAVLALTPDDMVVLVRQFRPGPAQLLLELPGGKVAEEEDVLGAASRELREETGYEADHLTLVGRTWLASYSTTERYAVVATQCRQTSPPHPDTEEFGETVLLSREAFLTHLRSGDLTDVDIAYMCLDWLTRRYGDDAS